MSATRLATIENITKIWPIEGADAIEAAQVLGWECVVKKGEFKVGDLVVFHNPDTLADKENPVYSMLTGVGYYIGVRRFRGQVSQGLALSLTAFEKQLEGLTLEPGVDVTERVKITKYSKPIPEYFDASAATRLPWPSYIRKTDQLNLRTYPKALEELHAEEEVVITQKLDGTSCTFLWRNGEVGVCSRNYLLLPPDPEKPIPIYWQIAAKYHLKERLAALNRNIALQGVGVGPDVNGNRLNLKEFGVYIFHVWDIDKSAYMDWDEAVATVNALNAVELKNADGQVDAAPKLELVPVLFRGKLTKTLHDLIDFANKGKYTSGSLAEGIVLSPATERHSPYLKSRLSVKVISEQYELKNQPSLGPAPKKK